jgi:hypothetical protein
MLMRKIRAHRPDLGHRPNADLPRKAPARHDGRIRGPLQRPTTHRSPSCTRPGLTIRRRSLPGADQATVRPRRSHQRIRARRVEAQVKTSGRVLETPQGAFPATTPPSSTRSSKSHPVYGSLSPTGLEANRCSTANTALPRSRPTTPPSSHGSDLLKPGSVQPCPTRPAVSQTAPSYKAP